MRDDPVCRVKRLISEESRKGRADGGWWRAQGDATGGVRYDMENIGRRYK